jgi:hypothetical protein
MIKVQSLILADRFQGVSHDWAGGNGSTETNVIYPADSKFGTVADFNGNAKIVITENQYFNFAWTESFTVSAWIYLDNTATVALDLIIARQVSGNGWRIARTGNNVEFLLMGHQIPLNANCAYEEWTHIAGVYKAGATYAECGGKIYKNGILQESQLDVYPNQYNNTSLIFGDYILGGYGFDGKLADVQIFNKALIESDIKRIMIGLKPLAA